MATNKPTYASASDLRDIYPNIAKYDAKTQVLGWKLGLLNFHDTSVDLYFSNNCGLINQLFWNGAKVDKITFNTTETTKLDGALTPSATVFYVDASHGLEGDDIVKIDEEYIRIDSVSSDTITISSAGVNRGLFGSAAQHHANDASVYKIIDASVDIGDSTSSDPDALSFVYDSDLDLVLLTTVTDPVDYLLEAGEDWATHQTDMLYKASRYLASYLDPSMPRQAWKNDEGEFDYIIIRTTAQICAYFLISAMDSENEDALKIKEEYESILDKINAGDIKLGFEVSADSSQGIIRELVASGTLKPVDIRGHYTGSSYDKVRIEIETAGVIGTAKMSCWAAGNDKLGINKGTQVITDQIISGQYQSIGVGSLEIRFGASTPTGTTGATSDLMTASSTLHDVWEVECWSYGMEQQDSRQMRSINAVRV